VRPKTGPEIDAVVNPAFTLFGYIEFSRGVLPSQKLEPGSRILASNASFLPAQDRGTLAETLDLMVAADGTGAQAYILSGKLISGPDALRNLADAVHYLCLLHGRFPGVLDHAATKTSDNAARKWLIDAAEAFATERAFVTKLSVAAGPLPSTSGQQQCEAAVIAQRHALDMLAQSDRKGCALGAAIALALDWRTIRAILDISAEKLDLTPPACTLPDLLSTAAMMQDMADIGAMDRAINFGAQQLLGQHRGLWNLLAAREDARKDAY
jgi:hypothetical protein